MQRTIHCLLNIGLFIMLISHLNKAYGEEWQLEKSQHNVQIFSRAPSPESPSSIKHIRARTEINAPPQAFIALLNDTASAAEWIHNCVKVEIIAGHQSSTKIVHSLFSPPWPLRKRDMVTQSTTQSGDGIVTIEIIDVGHAYPHNANTVRMRDIQGQWRLTAIDPQRTEVVYEGKGDPAGNIPGWLANQVIIDSTFVTFTAMVKIIEQRWPHQVNN